MAYISVIVPVYNAEDTLVRCMGSILAQTYTDLDIILIDDGSTDISGSMCDAYAKFDSRIRAVHTANRGLSAARNLGIELALSKGAHFIGFVDADDYLEPRMFEELLMALYSSGADIARCGVHVDGLRSDSEDIPIARICDRRQAVAALISGEIGDAVWNKLYRGFIFEKVRFPEGRVFEEIATMHRIVLSCERIVFIPYVGYHYVMREGSIAHSHSMANLADFWVACGERRDHLIDEVPALLDEEFHNELYKGMASVISMTWRWAYSNASQKRLNTPGSFMI